MPTYQYECEDCGPFSEVRPMADYEQPQPCPDCGLDAPRLLTIPAIGNGAQPADAAGPPVRTHAGGCACCGPRRLTADPV